MKQETLIDNNTIKYEHYDGDIRVYEMREKIPGDKFIIYTWDDNGSPSAYEELSTIKLSTITPKVPSGLVLAWNTNEKNHEGLSNIKIAAHYQNGNFIGESYHYSTKGSYESFIHMKNFCQREDICKIYECDGFGRILANQMPNLEKMVLSLTFGDCPLLGDIDELNRKYTKKCLDKMEEVKKALRNSVI